MARIIKALLFFLFLQFDVAFCEEQSETAPEDEAVPEDDSEDPAALMKQFDKNADGKLSWEEIETGAQESEVPEGELEKFSEFFKEADKNADGGLDEKELGAFVEHVRSFETNENEL